MAESRPITFDEETAFCRESIRLEDEGKHDEAIEAIKNIPISPYLARVWVAAVGKKAFLKEGYNLYEVEKEFGKEWVNT